MVWHTEAGVGHCALLAVVVILLAKFLVAEYLISLADLNRQAVRRHDSERGLGQATHFLELCTGRLVARVLVGMQADGEFAVCLLDLDFGGSGGHF